MAKHRMRGEYQFPKGLHYFPNFISVEEEQRLLQFITSLEYKKVVLHGQAAKRTVVHYGYTYDYEDMKVSPGTPFPDIVRNLSDKCAVTANIPRDEIAQCLISHYPPESTIGWHSDKLMFGPKVIGISLLSSCLMRFQKTVEDKRLVFEQELEPRSMYILSGSARYHWEHSIPKVEDTRYSITFRTLNEQKT